MKRFTLLILLCSFHSFSQEVKIQDKPIYSDGGITIKYDNDLDSYYFLFRNKDYSTIVDMKGISFKDKDQLLNFMNTMIEIFEKPMEMGDNININMNDYVIIHQSSDVSLSRSMLYKPGSKKAKRYDSVYIFVDSGYTSVKREDVNRMIESI